MIQVTSTHLGVSNFTLIRDAGAVIVDTGTGAGREGYERLFARLGVIPRQIGLIVISHGHTDHFAHVGELQELTGAPVLCHAEAAAALRTGKNAPIVAWNETGRKALPFIKGNEPAATRLIEPDLTMATDFDLTPYGVAGRVLATPGHTDCSVSVVLDSGEAVVGDLVAPSPFGGQLSMAYFATDVPALYASVRSLTGCADIFYTGHGGPYSRKEIMELL